MQVYIYCADIYCEDCGEKIRDQYSCDGLAPDDPNDETTYDSDEYPKGPYPDGGGEADCPQHCGSGAHCENAIELSDGRKIGVWLENDLTTDGVAYVRKAIQDGGEVAELWAEWYCDALNDGTNPDECPTDNCDAIPDLNELRYFCTAILSLVDVLGYPRPSGNGNPDDHDVLVPIPASLIRSLRKQLEW